ncbi:MAG: LuxR C-terminal-related transcriptional regulator [Egibacteraceae bacterium]
MVRRSLDDAVRSGAPALAGCHAAERLLLRVTADVHATPATIGIVGRGGTGKSALLDALDGVFTEAGLCVRRCTGRSPGGGLDGHKPDDVLLVDDAQWLDAEALRALVHFAEQAGAAGPHLAVAHRPWPRSKALAALDTALARYRPLVVLDHLDRAAVAERAMALLGTPADVGLLDVLCDWTGGLPAHVDSLATALLDEGQVRSGRLGGAPRMPAAMVEMVRAQLDQLDPEARSVLAATSLDAPVDEGLLSALLGIEPAGIVQSVEAVQAAGLMRTDGRIALVVRHAIRRLTPLVTRRTLQERLAGLIVDRGGSILTAGRHLLGTGASGTRAAGLLEGAGDEALTESPELARSLFDQAVQAGAPAETLAARRAEAAAFAGDLDAALGLADRTVTDPHIPDRARGVRVAAAVLAHRGLLARSAQLYRSLAGQPDGDQAALCHLLSVPCLLGTGSLEQATQALTVGDGQTTGPPSLLADAVTLTARGAHQTVTGPATVALSTLVQAASLLESSHRPVLLPDTPAALAAVVAHHSGDFDVADSVLGRAITAGVGEPAMAARHRLLQGWTALRRGHGRLARTGLDLARSLADTKRGAKRGRLEPRDELYAAALEIGLARRQGDLDGLTAAWPRAREALMCHPVDLFVLQPLGELTAGAARLGELGWIQSFVDDAWSLLDRLGDPPLWSAPMRWYALQSAIAADDLTAARHHADVLDVMDGAGAHSGHAQALTAAAHTWTHILAGDIDTAEIEASARRLHAAGLAWEASRLAGAGAIRARDRTETRALLGYARSLQAADLVQAAPSGAATLSEREREVASFVLAGLTYKQIGAQLFISAKTVEHHVARIRQRLGATTRAELLAQLRILSAQPETP